MLFPYENEILELEPFSLPTKVNNVYGSQSGYQQPQYGHQTYAPTTNTQQYRQTAPTAYSGTYQQPINTVSPQYQSGFQGHYAGQ